MHQKIILGPVLSFRGLTEQGVWQVTALVGCTQRDINACEPPALLCNGNPCPAPKTLLVHGKQCYYRYDLSVKLQKDEQLVSFGIGNEPGLQWHYTAPALDQAPRMAYVSCNGFSDPGAMRKLTRAANNVWADVMANHDKDLRPSGYVLDKEQMWHESRIHQRGLQRFHLMLMGGDQIYFDSIWEDIPALKHWVSLSRDEQLRFTVPKALEETIANYYFNLYAQRWLPPKRKPWAARSDALADAADAMARIPTIMMWDDHDIFDGWGSYSTAMQQCPLFKVLFNCARRAFWVFQMQHCVHDLPPVQNMEQVQQKDPMLKPIAWSKLRQYDAMALPLLDNQAGFTSAYQLGSVAILVPDLRTERSQTQIMGEATWRAIQQWMDSGLTAPKGAVPTAKKPVACQHVFVMSSVPVVHPKLTLVEGLLDTFGQDHVTDSSADDIKDHWSHDDHEGERKRLIEHLTRLAQKQVQVTLLSGDVHVAAWGTVSSSCPSPSEPLPWPVITQLTSSAVVHPSLTGVAERLFLSLLNTTAARPQRIGIEHTLEMMLFPGHNRYIMPARNWLALEFEDSTISSQCNKLWATWRCEGAIGFTNHLQVIK